MLLELCVIGCPEYTKLVQEALILCRIYRAVAYTDIGSLKSVRTLFNKYLKYNTILENQNRIDQNFEVLYKNQAFFKKKKHFNKALTHFGRRFCN